MVLSSDPGRLHERPNPRRPDEPIRAAEVIAALSLATDLGIGVPLEHGLESTLVAIRLAERLGVDAGTMSQVYYTCLLFYVGCTANADVAAEIFAGHDALTRYGGPVRFGARAQRAAGLMRAVAPPTGTPLLRARQLAVGLPRLVRLFPVQVAALCEVAQMLTDRLGLPTEIGELFAYNDERWDGRGDPGRAGGDEIPLAVRIVQVARDATFQRMLGGSERAVRIIRGRAGRAFDPAIARQLAGSAEALLEADPERDTWNETLACEPEPHVMLAGDAIDRALAAIGDFADLASPFLVGHSAGVARLAAGAGASLGLDSAETTAIRRAALVHDVGGRGTGEDLAEAGPAVHGRVGERASARVPHRARVDALTLPRRRRPDRDLPPRTTRRFGLSPGRGRRGDRPAGSASGRRRCLSRHDRAASASSGLVARRRGREPGRRGAIGSP